MQMQGNFSNCTRGKTSKSQCKENLKENKFASKILKEYLSENGENADFETFSVSDLDNA